MKSNIKRGKGFNNVFFLICSFGKPFELNGFVQTN